MKYWKYIMTANDHFTIVELNKKINEALSNAAKAIYFDDNADYEYYLWQIVKVLGGEEAVELLEEDSEEAYEKYCK